MGLSAFENTSDALEDGFQGTDVPRIALDTSIDFGTSTALVIVGVATGTAFIPIPVVGTLIGAATVFALNLWISKDGGLLEQGKDKSHD